MHIDKVRFITYYILLFYCCAIVIYDKMHFIDVCFVLVSIIFNDCFNKEFPAFHNILMFATVHAGTRH
jgi:hypothetical protein